MRKTIPKKSTVAYPYKIQNLFTSPGSIFVSLAALFGILMVFVMPVFMVPDETVHFYRAYQVGELQIVSHLHNGEVGGEVPPVPSQSVQTVNQGATTNNLGAPKEKFVSFPSSALYSPVGYIPQAAGIDIARVIHPSIKAMVVLGRMFNLATYILLVFIAIKIARKGKWVYAVVGLFPMAIQEAASLSTDVMTIGLAFVTIAFIHRLFLQDYRIERRQFILLILLAAGLGLTKQTNMVFLAPIVFLPRRLFQSNIRKAMFVVAILMVTLIVAALWYVAAKHYYHNLNFEDSIGLKGVNQIQQLKYVIHHPFTFGKDLFRTYIFEGFKRVSTSDFYWVSAYGYFSWLTYKLPLTFVMCGYAILFMALLYNDPREKYKDETTQTILNLAIIQTVVFILSLLAIAAALYLVWTPVGGLQVDGIQGRYFIPIIPLLIPLFNLLGRWVKLDFDKPYRFGVLLTFVAVMNCSVMLALTYRYFY